MTDKQDLIETVQAAQQQAGMKVLAASTLKKRNMTQLNTMVDDLQVEIEKQAPTPNWDTVIEADYKPSGLWAMIVLFFKKLFGKN